MLPVLARSLSLNPTPYILPSLPPTSFPARLLRLPIHNQPRPNGHPIRRKPGINRPHLHGHSNLPLLGLFILPHLNPIQHHAHLRPLLDAELPILLSFPPQLVAAPSTLHAHPLAPPLAAPRNEGQVQAAVLRAVAAADVEAEVGHHPGRAGAAGEEEEGGGGGPRWIGGRDRGEGSVYSILAGIVCTESVLSRTGGTWYERAPVMELTAFADARAGMSPSCNCHAGLTSR
ncbi:hypothetical protein VTI74DRAFT_11553 [Chaetomium olivicolor]